jgi:dienelactone hydrolase
MLKCIYFLPVFMCGLSFAQVDFLDAKFDATVTSDIVYGTGAVQSPSVGDKNLLLDVYEPTGVGVPDLKPGFIIIHGGGFTSGDKTEIPGMPNDYVSLGYVCVLINYRKVEDDPPTPGATPVERARNAAVEDAADAVRWVKANAAALGIDPTRIAIGGISAGAITALFEGYSELGEDASVDAVVSFSGGLYGHENLIDEDDPPVIQIHGDTDHLVEYSLALDLASAASSAGAPLALHTLADVGHEAYFERNTYTLPGGDTPNEKIQNFLYTHLRLATINSGPFAPSPGAMPVGHTTLMLTMLVFVSVVGRYS